MTAAQLFFDRHTESAMSSPNPRLFSTTITNTSTSGTTGSALLLMSYVSALFHSIPICVSQRLLLFTVQLDDESLSFRSNTAFTEKFRIHILF